MIFYTGIYLTLSLIVLSNLKVDRFSRTILWFFLAIFISFFIGFRHKVGGDVSSLAYAKYVGTGGNCGYEGYYGTDPKYNFECGFVLFVRICFRHSRFLFIYFLPSVLWQTSVFFNEL